MSATFGRLRLGDGGTLLEVGLGKARVTAWARAGSVSTYWISTTWVPSTTMMLSFLVRSSVMNASLLGDVAAVPGTG